MSVEALAALFPDYAARDLQRALDVSGGNANAAAELLLVDQGRHQGWPNTVPEDELSDTDSSLSVGGDGASRSTSTLRDFSPPASNAPPVVSSTAAPATPGVPVYLNVYHLQPPKRSWQHRVASSVGMGFFHSGVEVFGLEWSYGGSMEPEIDGHLPGVFAVQPGSALPDHHRKILLGNLTMNKSEFRNIVEDFRKTWLVRDYNLLSRNCNHFAEALVSKLDTKFEFPAWINRAAKVGNAVIPEAVINYIMKQIADVREAPPTADGSNRANRTNQNTNQNRRSPPPPNLRPNSAQAGPNGAFASTPMPANAHGTGQQDMRDVVDVDDVEFEDADIAEVAVLERATTIHSIIPDCDLGHIIAILQECGFNEEQALNRLLNEQCS